jgi:hypothetical protein
LAASFAASWIAAPKIRASPIPRNRPAAPLGIQRKACITAPRAAIERSRRQIPTMLLLLEAADGHGDAERHSGANRRTSAIIPAPRDKISFCLALTRECAPCHRFDAP